MLTESKITSTLLQGVKIVKNTDRLMITFDIVPDSGEADKLAIITSVSGKRQSRW